MAIGRENVDDMPDGIPAAGKRNLLRINMNKVIFFNLACVDGQVSVNLFPAEPLNRPSDQRRNVRMRIGMQSRLHRSLHVVWPTALAFGAGDEQVISCTGERAGIPLRGNETDGRGHAIRF